MRTAEKLYTFDARQAYRSRTIDELNSLVPELNYSKNSLSTSVQFYLENYRSWLDIPRLCRALAVPNQIAENFVSGSVVRKYEIIDRLDLKILNNISDRVYDVLRGFLKKPSLENLSKERKDAISTDISELSIYTEMYHNIDLVKSNPFKAEEFPYGNPFDHVLDIMSNGGVTIRFKYVSRNGSKPTEKAVSGHFMKHGDQDLLGIHVQGDKKFSMCKIWGQGDNMLVPLYPEYEDTTIRWGKEQAEAALDRKHEDEMELLY